jgi:hypothetical protein
MISLELGSSTIECSIRDLTAVGAGIEAGSGVAIPDRFQLTLDRGHTYRECRLVWRSNNRLGVEFTG